MKPPVSIFCQWQESDSRWICSQCGASVPKSFVANRPLAACRTGAEKNGIPFTSIAEARRDHKAFERLTVGPGTELKKMLSRVGIKATEGCPCNQRAIQMNVWGADECERRLHEIVGWLREESQRRRIPFIETLAVMIVKKAIRDARKNAA